MARSPFKWWTPEEDAQLMRLYGDVSKTPNEICAEMGRTWYSIVERAQRLKLHRPVPKAWSVEETERLIQIFADPSLEPEDIEAILGRSWSAITQKALRLGLKRPFRKLTRYNMALNNPRLWNDSHTAFLREHYPGNQLSIEEIARHLQRTPEAIIERARKLGLHRPFPNKYNINKRYFQVVDTEEQAYYLGLLAADGSILKSGVIEIELQQRDQHLVERFRDTIAPQLPLKVKNGIRMSFNSVEMVADLARYGIVRRKSYGFAWPQVLPENLAMPFLLGYFDGDGSLKRGWPGQWCWELLGCYDFLCDARERLMEAVHIQIAPPAPAKPKVSPHLYRLSIWSADKVILVDNVLNASRLGLPRKHTTDDDLFRLFTLTFFPEFRKAFRR